jgi:hypothetical protein
MDVKVRDIHTLSALVLCKGVCLSLLERASVQHQCFQISPLKMVYNYSRYRIRL